MSLQNLSEVLTLENLSPLEVICQTQDVKLLTRSLNCVKCNVDMTIKPFERSCDKYAWRCKKCRATKSVRVGSWFSRSHLPLQTILQITSMWCNKKPSWLVRRELNIAQNTVIDWYNFCREICVEIMLNHGGKLGGLGRFVEIAESKFEKPKYNRGNSLKGNLLFGGIERGSDRCFLQVVSNKSKVTMISLFEKYIEQGTTIIWDSYKAYECLGDAGFEYLKINYSISFKDPETKENSNSVEGWWSRMKQFLPDCNCNRGSFSSYLAEYMYRRLREDVLCLFTVFVNDIAKVYPVNTVETNNWRCESPKDAAAMLTNSDPMWAT